MANTEKIFLSDIKEGEIVKIVDIIGGRGIINKLNAMGVIPGSIIRVIKNSKIGPSIIESRGSKIIIGRGMANKIVVEK